MGNGKTLFDLFDSTIEKTFHLKRNGRQWILTKKKRYSTVDYCSKQIFAGIHARRGKLAIDPKSYAFYLGQSP